MDKTEEKKPLPGSDLVDTIIEDGPLTTKTQKEDPLLLAHSAMAGLVKAANSERHDIILKFGTLNPLTDERVEVSIVMLPAHADAFAKSLLNLTSNYDDFVSRMELKATKWQK